ncbi:serine/threonine protein kinase [Mycoplasmopsis pullorum]|uniref:serine/threonine protein kinase n=1 Tax=Mycoplasmopsis pullorum TaxID=48003 RepID=UPI0009FED46D|nr:serine/threonine-protein kinase [Mycoplasmopsis pullorum]
MEFKNIPPKSSTIYSKYLIKKILGAGGSATVYLVSALDNPKQLYALKYRVPDSNANNFKRFEQEAKILSKLKSVNIPYFVESYITAEEQYYVMEYIEGETLRSMIEKNGHIHTRAAVSYAKQIASGIGELHANSIVHRDIKSQNIIISKNQTVKIIDLGISLEEDTQRLTKTHNIMCSIYYAAPELADPKCKIQPTVDVYALGIVLFEMLTGDYPFQGSDARKTFFMHRDQELPSIMQIREIPQALENAVIKATAKDPKKRYQTMWELRADLETVLKPSRSLEEKISLKTMKPKKKMRDHFNSWKVSAIMCIIVVILIGVCLYFVQRMSNGI